MYPRYLYPFPWTESGSTKQVQDFFFFFSDEAMHGADSRSLTFASFFLLFFIASVLHMAGECLVCFFFSFDVCLSFVDRLTVALDKQELTSATEAACEVQHIRLFFSSIDAKYASGGSSTSSPSSSPGLSVVEAQVLQQLQQLHLRLLHLLFQKWTSIGLEGLREQQQRREEEREKKHQNQEEACGGEREGENEKRQGGQRNDQREDSEKMRGMNESSDPSRQNARLAWKQDLVHVFSLLKILNKQQDALKRYVDQMNGHLADVGVKTFK